MSSRSLLRSTTSSNMPRGIARPECLASTRRRINDGTRGALRQIRWHARPRPGTHTRTRARPPSLPPHVSLGHAGVRCCENREVRGHPARSDSAKLIVARVEFPRLTRPPSPHPRRLVQRPCTPSPARTSRARRHSHPSVSPAATRNPPFAPRRGSARSSSSTPTGLGSPRSHTACSFYPRKRSAESLSPRPRPCPCPVHDAFTFCPRAVQSTTDSCRHELRTLLSCSASHTELLCFRLYTRERPADSELEPSAPVDEF